MNQILKKSGVIISAAIMFSSCNAIKNANNTQKGAVIGTVGGAVIGGILGNNVGKGGKTAGGAVIGGVIGGVAGGIIGRRMDKQAEKMKRELPGVDVRRVGEGISVVFDEESGIYFESEKSNINAKSQQTLERLQGVLREYPDTNILVSGHTDSNGADSYNMQLSKNRANAVTNYLKTHGLDPNRFSVRWYGETQPKYDNTTASGRKKNRRVELGIEANEKMKSEAKAMAKNSN